ncbi:MAG: NusG domain II-containing protein [Bacillota bacterium]|nr:NusG domain II-containing protein [Bacillota bacterium]
MTKYDKILIIMVVVISLFGMYFVKEKASNYNKKYVEIIVDGTEHSKYVLDNNIDKEIEVITDKGYNIIHIQNGQVVVEESDCNNQLCVRKGVIEEPGELIVCLPHKVVVQITGSSEDLDSISY